MAGLHGVLPSHYNCSWTALNFNRMDLKANHYRIHLATVMCALVEEVQ